MKQNQANKTQISTVSQGDVVGMWRKVPWAGRQFLVLTLLNNCMTLESDLTSGPPFSHLPMQAEVFPNWM